MVLRCPSANGWVKLGQPVPLSNLVPPWNSGRPHSRQVKTPGRFSFRKTPQKGASVPCSRRTWRLLVVEVGDELLELLVGRRSEVEGGGVGGEILGHRRGPLRLRWPLSRDRSGRTAGADAGGGARRGRRPICGPVHGVAGDEALRRLQAQQASVAATDAIAQEFAVAACRHLDRAFARYRIVVLLTGTEPVADRSAARRADRLPDRRAGDACPGGRGDAQASDRLPRGAARRARCRLRPAHGRGRAACHAAQTRERFGVDAIRARAEQVSGVPVRVVRSTS